MDPQSLVFYSTYKPQVSVVCLQQSADTIIWCRSCWWNDCMSVQPDCLDNSTLKLETDPRLYTQPGLYRENNLIITEKFQNQFMYLFFFFNCQIEILKLKTDINMTPVSKSAVTIWMGRRDIMLSPRLRWDALSSFLVDRKWHHKPPRWPNRRLPSFRVFSFCSH